MCNVVVVVIVVVVVVVWRMSEWLSKGFKSYSNDSSILDLAPHLYINYVYDADECRI